MFGNKAQGKENALKKPTTRLSVKYRKVLVFIPS